MAHVTSYRQLCDDDFTKKISDIMKIDDDLHKELTIEDGVVITIEHDDNEFELYFTFFPNPLGVVKFDNQYGTVGILHHRCDCQEIRDIIKWYNQITEDNRCFPYRFWYVDRCIGHTSDDPYNKE
jgi:hypothetical protein